jgi:hypothetical protein
VLLTTTVIMTVQNDIFFTKTHDYQEMCDTNQNVTKMGVITRRVYCNLVF